jgi:hypothetical protein
MGWTEEYDKKNIVADYTKPLKKIWDTLMPTSYPYIIDFDTDKAVEVKLKRSIGPYNMEENFIDYECSVTIDNQPLLDIGWDGGPITDEMAKKAYGELYFLELRAKMVELMKYAGLKFSTFDAGGVLNAKAKDL